jgi:hypothetical protein
MCCCIYVAPLSFIHIFIHSFVYCMMVVMVVDCEFYCIYGWVRDRRIDRLVDV